MQLQLWSKNAACEEPRYTFTVIDIHKSNAKNGQFAIFIVPQGKYVNVCGILVWGRHVVSGMIIGLDHSVLNSGGQHCNGVSIL